MVKNPALRLSVQAPHPIHPQIKLLFVTGYTDTQAMINKEDEDNA
jgi:hypothetical protein